MPTKNSQHADFAFIIPTLSNTKGLKNVLADIARLYPKAPVIVVNNSNSHLSTSLGTISHKLSLQIINNKKNEGFAKASNDGAKYAREYIDPKHLIFLNDDVRFLDDWVHTVVAFMKKKDWQAGAPVLTNEKGIVENYGYRVLSYGRVELIKDRQASRIDGITAAALLFDTRVFFKLNGFDERFFAYLEDVDLFLRAKKAGVKFGVVPTSTVLHYGQVTSSTLSVQKAFLDFKNWILLIAKNWGVKKILAHLPAIALERARNLWGIVKAFSEQRLPAR